MLFRSDRKSTRLNSSHTIISYAVFCLKKKKEKIKPTATEQTAKLTSGTPKSRARRARAARRGELDRHASRGSLRLFSFFFFFNNRGPPKIYPFPLHNAFPI